MTLTAALQLGGALPVFGVLVALLTVVIVALKRSSGLLDDRTECPQCDSAVDPGESACPACGAPLDGR